MLHASGSFLVNRKLRILKHLRKAIILLNRLLSLRQAIIHPLLPRLLVRHRLRMYPTRLLLLQFHLPLSGHVLIMRIRIRYSLGLFVQPKVQEETV